MFAFREQIGYKNHLIYNNNQNSSSPRYPTEDLVIERENYDLFE